MDQPLSELAREILEKMRLHGGSIKRYHLVDSVRNRHNAKDVSNAIKELEDLDRIRVEVGVNRQGPKGTVYHLKGK